ncbi:hypothetical protein SAMD00019534_115220 [Acytostelium subglobosum LB1]|uniref:hypothetical protein n=1 Tax=Acytostelium subglobosum LB1 TaxID=1410327 RepID=UPI0006451AE0|nr:hypothetical protein SAMD00019534_115220 [Acytostelium subglobosum LB1]GAM28346.1 hypothetical protein SAMD00019534_115220 [Acytostelium subglobosum LB1]|eukprot:XP_012748663.1 hypothetical protein SAMD00019534_115220 [Acytostelium subglobosum LB1]
MSSTMKEQITTTKKVLLDKDTPITLSQGTNKLVSSDMSSGMQGEKVYREEFAGAPITTQRVVSQEYSSAPISGQRIVSQEFAAAPSTSQRVYLDNNQSNISIQQRGKEYIHIEERGAPHISIVENAPKIEIQQRVLTADLELPPARVDINQPTPKIFLEQQAPIIDVNQMAPRVEFVQREPIVHVNQPKAQVIINQVKPEVKIQSAKPVITVGMSDIPQIQVQHQDPIVHLFKSEPIVNITQSAGQAEIIFTKAEHCVLNYRQSMNPILFVNTSQLKGYAAQQQLSSSGTIETSRSFGQAAALTKDVSLSKRIDSSSSGSQAFEKADASWFDNRADNAETSYVPVTQL